MKLLTGVLFFSMLSLAGFGQVEYPGMPRSLEKKLKVTPAEVVFPGVTPQFIRQYESSLSPSVKSMVFAYPFDTQISCKESGTWEQLPDGSSIWRLLLHSPNASSINLIFNRFKLPDGAALFLYTPGYEVVRGAFTHLNHTRSGVLPTVPIPGDRLVVELNLPANPEFQPIVEISTVSHDYKGVFTLTDSRFKAGDCNVDINCPPGADWQTEKRAVVKFIRGGYLLCSGSLINNTRNDGRALLLTANHTIGNETHAQQSLFFFRYERPTCGTGNGSTQFSLSGSTLLATTSKLDFCLVELSSQPPKTYEPYYAGWDRRVVPYLDTVVGIHHPSGSVKKISKSYHRVVTGDFGGGYDKNTHWLISQWDLGTTEGGSSGSPLFNSDHRIVGDLTGGDASCTYNFNDYYQKLSVSWDKYPDSSNQLRHWLDPKEEGVEVINGWDPYSNGRPLANFTIRPGVIEVGKRVYVTDLSTGAPTSWSWTFEGGYPGTSNRQTPPAVRFGAPGVYRILLKVSNENGIDSLAQTITVADYSAYSLSDNRVVPGRIIEMSDQSSSNPFVVNWEVTGPKGQSFAGSEIELSLPDPGEYSVRYYAEFREYSDTLLHYNQIRVLPDVITYQSFSFSNVEKDEHTGYQKISGQGYLPGSNNQQVTAYAESFRNNSDTVFIINGITLPLEVLPKTLGDYYLPLVVWNGSRREIMRDSIKLSGYQPGSRITKWFRSPVSFDTLLYAGFEVRPWDQGTFAARMATDRGASGRNTAFVIKGSQWLPMSDYGALHTSLDIALETSVQKESFKEEIRILPNFSSGEYTLDLGTLVFDRVDITVFSLSGQQITSEVAQRGNQVSFRMEPPVSGVYIVRLRIGEFTFSTKLMILKD